MKKVIHNVPRRRKLIYNYKLYIDQMGDLETCNSIVPCFEVFQYVAKLITVIWYCKYQFVLFDTFNKFILILLVKIKFYKYKNM